MQLTLKQHIFTVKSHYETEAAIKLKPSSELFFQNVYHQVKQQFEKILNNMRGITHL